MAILVRDFLPNWMIFFHLSTTWLSDLYITKKCVFCWYTTAEKRKFDFFQSLNHVGDKWKKIIQFGKKSWPNMPFHLIVPSPTTALKETEFGAFIFAIEHISFISKGSVRVSSAWVNHICLKWLLWKESKKYPFKSWFDRSMNAFSCIFSHSIGTEGITIQLTFSWSSCPSGPNASLLIPNAHLFSNPGFPGIGFIFPGIKNQRFPGKNL